MFIISTCCISVYFGLKTHFDCVIADVLLYNRHMLKVIQNIYCQSVKLLLCQPQIPISCYTLFCFHCSSLLLCKNSSLFCSQYIFHFDTTTSKSVFHLYKVHWSRLVHSLYQRIQKLIVTASSVPFMQVSQFTESLLSWTLQVWTQSQL